MGTFLHSRCAAKVRGIEAYHRDTKKWADIAYNALVCPHGYVFEGRGVGVKSAANGSTLANDNWYAVCYLGGERDSFTSAAKVAMDEAVQWLRRNGAGRRVNGHRDHKATMCPGPVIYQWLNTHDFNRSTTVTNVEKLRTAIQKAINDYPVSSKRPAATAMVAAIRTALRIGPKR